MTHTHDACPAIPKENMLTFKPKFKRGYHGDVATVRDGKAGSGVVKGNGENESADEESDFTVSSSDEEVENEDTEEVILFMPPARMSAGFDSSGKSGSQNRSPAVAVEASATNSPTKLQILVDRQKWKMQYDYEQLSEQTFRARVVLMRSEKEKEALSWSQASGSKQKAKHAAAEIALMHPRCL